MAKWTHAFKSGHAHWFQSFVPVDHDTVKTNELHTTLCILFSPLFIVGNLILSILRRNRR
jgi:hypothetical protein